jgi:hypothetical protein
MSNKLCRQSLAFADHLSQIEAELEERETILQDR